jgi:hypothetical protein
LLNSRPLRKAPERTVGRVWKRIGFNDEEYWSAQPFGETVALYSMSRIHVSGRGARHEPRDRGFARIASVTTRTIRAESMANRRMREMFDQHSLSGDRQ